MDTFKISLIVVNRKIKSNNLSSIELNLFQKLLDREEVEGLNIQLSCIRKNSAEFTSTNDKTIKSNIHDFYHEETDPKQYFEFMYKLNSELDKALKCL